MHIARKIADACPNGIDCPRAYELEGGDLMIQGDRITDPDVLLQLRVRPGESAVAVPPTLRVEAITNLGPCDVRHDRQHVRALPVGALVVVGRTVTHPDLLRKLHLPPTEAAVHVPRAALHSAPPLLREAV